MDPLILDYFSDWRSRRLTCPSCGWEGTFSEGWTEIFDGLQDCLCPGAHDGLDRPMLAILQFPTEAEWRERWDELPEAEKRHIDRWYGRA